jgi:dTDP-4-dehydrorhamnose reductase
MKKKVVLYGGEGLLGSEIKKQFAKKYTLISPPHNEIDVTQKSAVSSHLFTHKPDYIIYTVGVSRIDLAEQNPKLAYKLNADTPEILTKLAKKMDIPFIFFSSDAVFDGSSFDRPFKENDPPKPVSTYGKSKFSGEQAVLAASEKNIVLRVIMLYSAFYAKKRDFTRIILELLKKGTPTAGIVDQYISPLFTVTAANALNTILLNEVHGIYHLASTNSVSNYDFVKTLAKTFGLDEKLVLPVTLADFLKDKTSHRAKYACLDTKKFQQEFGEGILHTIEEDLTRFKREVNLPRNTS